MSATQGASVSITGMGELMATTSSPGQHGYVLEHPTGHPSHIPTPYVIKPPKDGDEKKPATAGHFFGLLSTGLSGAMSIVWRLSYKAVNSKLHPTKPFVMATNELKLEEGKPVHVGGPGADAEWPGDRPKVLLVRANGLCVLRPATRRRILPSRLSWLHMISRWRTANLCT